MKVATIATALSRVDQEDQIVAEINNTKVILRVGNSPVCSIDIPRHLVKVRELANLRLDTTGRSVSVDGKHVYTTRIEFDLLFAIANAFGAVVERESLFTRFWGGCGDKHVVDVHMSNLRRKLERAGWTQKIETIRGVGFRLV